MTGGAEIVRLSDRPELLLVAARLVREYVLLPDAWEHVGGPPDLLPRVFEDELSTFPGSASPPEGEVFVALYADEPSGVGLLVPLAGDTAEIKRVYVRSHARRTGLGRGLVGAMLTTAGGYGYQRVVVDIMPTRLIARRLYESLGFLPTEPYRVYDDWEMIYMERRLDSK